MTKISIAALAGGCAAALMLTGCQGLDLEGAPDAAAADRPEVCLIPYLKSEQIENALVQGFAKQGLNVRVLDAQNAKPGDCGRTLAYGVAANEKKQVQGVVLQGFINGQQALKGTLPPDDKGQIKVESVINILAQAVVHLVNPQAAQQQAQQPAQNDAQPK